MRIGIDIGGQSIKCGLVDETGRITDTDSFPVNLSMSSDEICEKTAKCAENLIYTNGFKIKDIVFAGAGVPGRVNFEAGVVLHTPNISLNGYSLGEALSSRLGIPVALGNDADCAALGEFYFGSGKNYSSVIFMTLGTGLGGGIIIDGKLLQGQTGAAGEIGHMVICHGGIQCGCGRKGCFEQYASATALVRMTRESMSKDTLSYMWKLAGSLQDVSGKTAFDAAEAGDVSARNVIEQYFDYLSAGIINLANIFEPEAVIIGGGISHEKPDNFIVPLGKKVTDRIIELNTVEPPLLHTAVLGNSAGIIGAAFLNNQF